MDLSSIPIVATAISIVICWSLFALFCSFVQEAIAQIKAERGRYMKKWLLRQLFDQPNGVNWASMLYLHGTVDLLTRTSNKPTSDIAPKLFAETLIEVVGNAQIVQMRKQRLPEFTGADNSTPRALPFNAEVLNNFKAATLCLKPSDVVSFFQQAMRSAELCNREDGSPDETAIYSCLKDQIEKWYVEMTERLTLWYKKRTRLRLFLLGVVLAAIVNIDSAELFSHFSKDPASRKVVMEYYEANAGRLNEMAAATSDTATLDSIRVKIQAYAAEMDSVAKQAGLPVGWDHSLFNGKNRNQKPRPLPLLIPASSEENQWNQFRQLLNLSMNERFWWLVLLWQKLPGLLLSGFAASFGAPFWFDMLKKIYSRKPQNV